MKKRLKTLVNKVFEKITNHGSIINNSKLSQFIQFLIQRGELSSVIFVGDKHKFKGILSSLNNVLFINSITKLDSVDLSRSIVVLENLKLQKIGSEKYRMILQNVPFVVMIDNLATTQQAKSFLDDNDLKNYNFGVLSENGQQYQIILAGKYAKPNKVANLLSVLAIVSTFNEGDIIQKTIEHLLQEGIHVHLLDNWSTDGSFEVLKDKYSQDGRVTLERFPDVANNEHDWHRMLSRKEDISKEGKYNWYMHYDADEIRISPWNGVTLQEAISFVDIIGFNAIDFTVVDFRPINELWDQDKDLSVFEYLEFGKRPGHFLQVKCWKHIKDVNITDGGGHEAKFEGRKIYPLKFLMKHYPLRSTAQAKKKIFTDRLPRIEKGNKLRGWHTHYKSQSEIEKYIWDKNDLIKYDSEFGEKYLIERLTGVGLVK